VKQKSGIQGSGITVSTRLSFQQQCDVRAGLLCLAQSIHKVAKHWPAAEWVVRMMQLRDLERQLFGAAPTMHAFMELEQRRNFPGKAKSTTRSS